MTRRQNVIYWSIVAMIFVAIGAIAYPSHERSFEPAPKKVKTVHASITSNIEFKTDRIMIEEVKPFLLLMVEAGVPADTTVPPDMVEEEPDEKMPPIEKDQISKPERTKFKDVCARNGGRKQTYYKGKHEMWRCVYEK